MDSRPLYYVSRSMANFTQIGESNSRNSYRIRTAHGEIHIIHSVGTTSKYMSYANSSKRNINFFNTY